ncbi:MAG: ATP synthase F1 subunit gamma [Planctomycetes bacterium]|nr:ATP synthase F1 subunit gamma [Planctomycetota bacterium]
MAIMNIKTIRRKIRSVNNIKKITRAMQMVSASKLKKVQGRLLAIRPYAGKIRELLEGLVQRTGGAVSDSPLFRAREKVARVTLVVLTADKGLCGAYNSNLLRAAATFAAGRKNVKIEYFPIGRKAVDALRRAGEELINSLQGLPTEPSFAQIQTITHELQSRFSDGKTDEVHIAYSRYVNPVTFKPEILQFLPISPKAAAAPTGAGKPGAVATASAGAAEIEYIFEPSPKEILDRLIPKYVEVLFYRLLLESLASEHSARMNAMRNATDNATDMIGSMTLQYNKARQAAITKELLDIVGGAEALRG